MASGHVLQPTTRIWTLSVSTGKLPYNGQILSSFTWRLVTIRRGLTGLFWIVWKLFGTEQCLSTPPMQCRRLSHPGPDVSTGTVYQSLVATLSLVYTAPSAAPWIWHQFACFQPLSPSLLLTLWHYLKGLACVCVGWVWGGRSDQGNGASVESQWIQRANKNRGQCAAQGRLNICSDNILTGASLMGGWCASMCIYMYLYKNGSPKFSL